MRHPRRDWPVAIRSSGYGIIEPVLPQWEKNMFKPQRLAFDELSDRLRAYERKYGYSTIEFYRRFENGELGDDDDLMLWAGLYHLYLTSLPIRQFMQSSLVAA